MNGVVEVMKYRDPGWDFRAADTKTLTHCFHIYPAMMIPQVAARILDEFGLKARTLFDPYCGTGTSLVEASVRGINAIGTDINPLARLVAKVKTTPIDIDSLDKYLKDFNDFTFQIRLGARKITVTPPRFNNIDYWFKPETQRMLAAVKEFIDDIPNRDIRDFFCVAFSETIREVSLTKNSEFKLYRMSKKQISRFNPDVLSIMLNKLVRNRNGMSSYLDNRKPVSVKVYDFNTVYGIPEEILPPESVDIVVTSPPYGDSRTTVAYGQFSRLSIQWLGLQPGDVDKRCMGGVRKSASYNFSFAPLANALACIAKKDPHRVLDVVSFYIDYQKSITNVAKVVRPGGIVAYVVGNRRVKGVEIPHDEVTRNFFEKNGFRHIKTIIRAIPNKRMPKRNSPSNIAGETDTTMNYEHIIILQKVQ